MRGLLMALFAVDFPGHDAGRRRALFRSTKTMAKTTAKTV
jgi:surfactin synthase thioesterase subunit